MVLIPEIPTPLEEVAACLSDAYMRGKVHGIILVAEGYQKSTEEVRAYLAERKDDLGFSIRVTVLGHVQRGGSPSGYDRILASRLGHHATELLFETVSAFGTVGLSLGATARLDGLGKAIVMLLMLAGRVGPLSLALLLGSRRTARIAYPEAKIMVG